jgi:hypothetical protein
MGWAFAKVIKPTKSAAPISFLLIKLYTLKKVFKKISYGRGN